MKRPSSKFVFHEQEVAGVLFRAMVVPGASCWIYKTRAVASPA